MDSYKSRFLTAQFYAWELRGRGWDRFDFPVHLEPTYIPFHGHFIPPKSTRLQDEGLRKGILSNIKSIFTSNASHNVQDDMSFLEEAYPTKAYPYSHPEPLGIILMQVPLEYQIDRDKIAAFIRSIVSVDHITTFEIIGTGQRITIQCSLPESQVNHAIQLAKSYLPDLLITSISPTLDLVETHEHHYIHDIGLRHEYMSPIATNQKFNPDPLTTLISTLELLQDGETGIFQVLTQPVVNDWASSMTRAIHTNSNEPFFEDAPTLVSQCAEKLQSKLLATCIRTVGAANNFDNAKRIASSLAKSLDSFSRVGSNEFYVLGQHSTIEDVIDRVSLRTGMLLSLDELVSVVHIPDQTVHSKKLLAGFIRGKRIDTYSPPEPCILGLNQVQTQSHIVSLSIQDRLRHTHIIGATGSGKSNLLTNLIVQDIVQGIGVTVFDPHGDLIDTIASHIPDNRLKDVILFDPSDSEFPIGFNIFQSASATDEIVLSSDIISIFKKFATSWGDVMHTVLSNAVIALIQALRTYTIADLRRFLLEDEFRQEVLSEVSDPTTKYYWTQEYPLIRKGTISPILTRLNAFLRSSIVRFIVSQKKGIDLNKVVNSNSILLVKLSHGLIGKENSYMLGSLLLSKLTQSILARQQTGKEKRKPHFIYMDEFQHFMVDSVSTLLTDARKYTCGLIMAHQDMSQLQRKNSEVAETVLANTYTRICFRLGDVDSKQLASSFSYFEANDLQSLAVGEAIVRIGTRDNDGNLTFKLKDPQAPEVAQRKLNEIQRNTRNTYCIPANTLRNAEIEAYQKSAPQASPSDNVSTTKKEIEHDLPSKAYTHPIEVKESFEGPPLTPEVIEESAELVENAKRREYDRYHTRIQERIKNIAQSLQCIVKTEESVLDNAGRIDVSIRRGGQWIGIEVSVTNTVEYEVKNIQKCLDAGCNIVIMTSPYEAHLNAIQTHALTIIDNIDSGKVWFSMIENIQQLLESILDPISLPEELVHGRTVKVSFVDCEDLEARRKALSRLLLNKHISENLKKK